MTQNGASRLRSGSNGKAQSPLNNSTISGNDGHSCGGLCNVNPTQISVNSSTITGNSAHSSGAGGVGNYYSGVLTLRNSILAGNTPADCQDQLTLAGNNILGTTSNCTYLRKTDTDRVNLNPQLAPLTGSPAFHPLLPESPAINGGAVAGCMDHLLEPLLRDQRGMPRVGRCDVGAYETGLAIEKRVHGNFAPGSTVSYLLSVLNIERTAVFTGVVVSDALPVGLELLPNSVSADSGVAAVVGNSIVWNGSVSGALPARISFRALISPTVPWYTEITNTAVASWSGFDTAASATFTASADVYLPVCIRNFCGDFFDDFSNIASGWPVGDSGHVRAEYLNGEYRILAREGGYLYLFQAPTCQRESYTVETDVRWAGATGDSYGLLLGIKGNFDQYFLFDVNADYQMYRLFRRDASGFTQIVPPTRSYAIRPGSNSNHLKATLRTGFPTGITLEINGTTLLQNAYITTIEFPTGVGVISSAYYEEEPSDARFDNFRVTRVEVEGMPSLEVPPLTSGPVLRADAPVALRPLSEGALGAESVRLAWSPRLPGPR